MIFIVLIIGFALRIVNLGQSLWLDEAIGAIEAKNFSYSHLLTSFLRVDNHPPFYYLLLKFWSSIFGYSEFSLRFPSVVFGVGTIYFTYLIAKELTKDKYIPLVSALLISVSSFFIYYSQEARMYSMAAFLASIAVYSYLRLLKESKNFWWGVFSVSITALVFTDYMPVFLLPVFWIWTMYKKRSDKSWLNKFVLSYLPIIGFGILWLPVFLAQKEGGTWLLRINPRWRNVAGGANLKEVALVWTKFVFGRISLAKKTLYYFLVFLASVPVVFSLWKVLKSKKLVFLWLWLVVPLTLGLFASIFFPAFIYFRYLYIVPAFYLLITFGAFQYKQSLLLRSKKKIVILVIFLIVVSNFVSWLIYVKDKTQQREDWRQATAFVESKGNKDSVAVFEYPDPFAPYRWYAKGGMKAVGVLDSIVVRDPKKVDQLVDQAVRDRKEVYHFEYLRDLSDPNRVVEERLRQDGFQSQEQYGNFYGVGIITRWARK